jgi:hypothetical protein
MTAARVAAGAASAATQRGASRRLSWCPCRCERSPCCPRPPRDAAVTCVVLVLLALCPAQQPYFSGQLPAAFGQLSALSRLDLYMSKLYGSLPPGARAVRAVMAIAAARCGAQRALCGSGGSRAGPHPRHRRRRRSRCALLRRVGRARYPVAPVISAPLLQQRVRDTASGVGTARRIPSSQARRAAPVCCRSARCATRPAASDIRSLTQTPLSARRSLFLNNNNLSGALPPSWGTPGAFPLLELLLWVVRSDAPAPSPPIYTPYARTHAPPWLIAHAFA